MKLRYPLAGQAEGDQADHFVQRHAAIDDQDWLP